MSTEDTLGGGALPTAAGAGSPQPCPPSPIPDGRPAGQEDGGGPGRLVTSVLDSLTSRTAILDGDGTIVAVNSAWRRHCRDQGGESGLGRIGVNYLSLCAASGESHAGEVAGAIEAVLSGEATCREVHYPRPERTGDEWFTMRVSRLADRAGAVVSHVDISGLRRAEGQLEFTVLHDPLTALPNRALFLDRLSQALSRSERRGTYAAVLQVDIDHFKLVNDTYGRRVGDLLLVEVAKRLSDAVRAADTVARLGGDEFAVLIEDLSGPAEASAFAERLSDVLERPYVVGKAVLHLSASIGIALSVDRGVPEELLTNADTALSRAKERGKGRSELFSHVLRARFTRRTHVEQGLRRALEEEELEVVYQPVVDVRTGAIVEGEALLRWYPREWDFVAPTEFIPVAEQSGVILPLGRWVLRKACAAAARWAREGCGKEVRVAVNVSGQQLARGQILSDVGEALMATGLSPRLLRLEITESVLLDDPVVAVRALEELRRLGVAISVDDFGTGYSSLLYLRDFPVDTIKVDRLFVAGLGPRGADTAIVDAVVRLAHALELEVTAEGVETEDQLHHLAGLGCDAAQGFLWSPGVPVDDFRRLLTGASAAAPAAPGRPARRPWPTSCEAPHAAHPTPASRRLA